MKKQRIFGLMLDGSLAGRTISIIYFCVYSFPPGPLARSSRQTILTPSGFALSPLARCSVHPAT